MLFATACFAAYLWSTYLVPETAGVSLEDVDTVFGTSAGADDSKAKEQVSSFDAYCRDLRACFIARQS